MDVIEGLLGEHAVFYKLFDEMEDAANRPGAAAKAREVLPVLMASLVSHAQLEDELLPPGDELLEASHLLEIMMAEHTEIHRTLERAEAAADDEQALGLLLHAITLAREHFEKEENLVFPLVRQVAPPGKLQELGARWADARGVAIV